jgi:5'-deoxynucleotidase YfbR-like HD superfamily hydrolase
MTKRETEAYEAVVRIADALEKLLEMIEEERNGDDTGSES